ncbi:RluA family pseudouridine synthase [Desulfuribacillus alkaliarsenatis]|uniref:Pseudouridine synthase n=1 Tax=Desulfuribacillus alkaliarsenatis TaxID=766136 RepID=A0A1E5FZX8_9FIRM|nr:RluA family pseudouridine synthase [Desulfuribacillus alkaliarsenatis]OEF96053.1 RNA pseudouridine synthase [Desulfuribacillus alkaliarsenatis]
MNPEHFLITTDDTGVRIDKWLHEQLPELSRSLIQLYIQNGSVKVNECNIKVNYKIKENDHIVINFPEPEEVTIAPEKIDLNIIYEDADLIVVNKPRGMVVHPAQGHYTGTLVNALLYHCKDLSGINGELRPGIVHRIDKDTTGIIVAAKNDLSHRHLSEQFKEHSIIRKYVALVHGLIPNSEGTVIAPIGRHKTQRKKMAVDVEKGKTATTHFKVLNYYNDYTLLELTLETGRTHQIRVHMAYIGHPVAADPLYGYRKSVNLLGQALHAKELGFVHPKTGKQMHFTSELPNDFKKVLTQL